MNSKEALEKLCSRCYIESEQCTCHPRYKGGVCYTSCEYKEAIEQDLDRLEKLEKALDKACEKLDYTCPVEEELVEDLDCDDCDNNCKDCWKKYFMKEVLHSA